MEIEALNSSTTPKISPVDGEFRMSDVYASSEAAQLEMQNATNQAAKNERQWQGNGAPISPTDAARARCPSTAAKELQKVYRSYRTRRMLADSAVVAEELWWQALDFARLNHSTISFFQFLEPEKAASRWNRVGLNASKVGKGLSRLTKNDKAQKLAFQHWIEAIDPRHRYGHNLHLYYDEWFVSSSGQPFFYWLDLGDGKDVDLKECPRTKLRQQCIKYLGPQEREHYEYAIIDGIILNKQTRKPLATIPGSKWIFVMSTSKRLYAGEKKKGLFHHSSFLAGGATLAAGRLVVENGVLKRISAYSGHYKPTEDSLNSFLLLLKENGVNLDEVEIGKADEDYEYSKNGKSSAEGSTSDAQLPSDSTPNDLHDIGEDSFHKKPEPSRPATTADYRRTFSGGLRSPKVEVPKRAMLQRINSKKAAKSYQLGRQLSVKWSTGAGPRIGCIADYPVELRRQALELTNLSPRPSPPPLWTPKHVAPLVSAVSCPPDLSNDITGVPQLRKDLTNARFYKP